MTNARIYSVAKEYKISSNALLKILAELGFKPKSHMSVATDAMLLAVRKKFEAEKEAVKKDIEQKKKPRPKTTPSKPLRGRKLTPSHPQKEAPPKKAAPPQKGDRGLAARAEEIVDEHAGDSRVVAPKAAPPKPAKPSKRAERRKRRDRRKKKDVRKVDHKAVVKSFKATLASMGGTTRRPKRYKKGEKGAAGEEIDHENSVEVNEFMTIAELAEKMNMKPAELIAKCFEMGMMASINQRLDMDTIETLALECGFNIRESAEIGEEAREDEQEENLTDRAPVVTVMGHVDHGKTSLLDYIRHTNVVADEAGAITQHIGAYVVSVSNGNITFIDTPGHEAFTAMRARGAQATDMVVLVVAADDGVKPQTIEAIDHARAANVPILVAINKIDKPAANSDMVKQQLAQHNLSPEEWGGKTIMVDVSAKSGQGIDQLLEMILLQAEMLDLKADPTINGQGVIVEANLEKGRGPTCTVIIQKGAVRIGDPICAGPYHGRVRVMLNEHDRQLDEAGPSVPVKVVGLNGVPQAGDSFMVVNDDQEARQIAVRRMQIKREHEIRRGFGPATLENIYEQIRDGQIKELKLVIKTDVDGSAEVLSETLSKIATSEVRTVIIRKGVGGITESDVLLAVTSGAIIIGFNVRPDSRARETAAKEKVDIRLYNVIYEVENDVRKALEGMLSPEVKESFTGMAEVRQIFKVPKVGTVAGCFIKEGTIHRSDKVHVVRDSRVIYTGTLSSLKRFKDDVREVAGGYECGIGVEDFNDVKEGDMIEAFTLVETARKIDI